MIETGRPAVSQQVLLQTNRMSGIARRLLGQLGTNLSFKFKQLCFRRLTIVTAERWTSLWNMGKMANFEAVNALRRQYAESRAGNC